MSTADDVEAKFYEWLHDDPMRETGRKHDSVVSGLLITYEAGYRRALEDAADEYDRRADRDKDAIGARANVAIVCRDHAAELRAMAAGVGTKDGADDE